MAISPMDIHLKEFSTVSTGGYDKEEVDSFLDSVADELERAKNRASELEDEVASMRKKVSQFDEMQKTLQNALMNAQKSAGNILQEARSEAAAIIKKAQDRSDRVIEDMQREKDEILSSFAAIRAELVERIPPMRGLLDKSQGLLAEYETSAKELEIKDLSTVEPEEEASAAEDIDVPEPAPAPVEVEEVEQPEEAAAVESTVEKKSLWE